MVLFLYVLALFAVGILSPDPKSVSCLIVTHFQAESQRPVETLGVEPGGSGRV